MIMRAAFCHAFVLCAAVLLEGSAFADANRTQTISLRAGWNAVYLEVFPSEPEPSKLFAGTPIDIAASYYAALSTAQFISNPSADLLRQSGWAVWYADSREDAFLTTLHAIQAGQPYLIFSKRDFTWAVHGLATPARVHWQADSFNLVGFSVAEQGAPTFAQFFSGSKAHQHNRIYRLSDGIWRQVTEPGAETLRSGEAFWIYCEGGSEYQGPLRVETPASQGLVLRAGVEELILRNDADYPVAARLEHVAPGADSVPLSIVVTAVGDASAPVQSVAVPKPDGAWAQQLPPIEPGAALKVPFAARRRDQEQRAGSSLLKISTDIGTEIWVPVFSIREDLEK